MDLQPDEWMGNILGSAAYNLRLQRDPYSSDDPILAPLSEEGVFAFCKISVDAVEQAAFLEDIGFRLVDTNLLLQRKTGPTTPPENGDLTFAFAQAEDDRGATDLASDAFIFTRFHQDPKIDNAVANRVKGEWVHNFFLGKRGNQMVLAKDGDRVVGFLQLLIQGENLIIDLIATDSNYRKRGIAHGMIRFAEANIKGVSQYLVGTQIANIPSIKLYQKLGFFIREAKYVFHYHSQQKR